MPYRRQHRRKVTWYASFRDGEGRPVQERAGSYRDAKRLEKQRKQEVQDGIYSREHRSGTITVARYAETWIKQRTNRSRDKDAQILRDYVVKELGLVQLDQMTTAHGVRLARKVAGYRSSSIVGSVMRVLRVLFRDAALEGLIPSNPVTLPRGVIQTKRPEPREIYQREEVERLLTTDTILPHVRVMLALAFWTGMRKGEICGRRWRDIDRETQWCWALRVHSQYCDQPLKTDNPRTVPIHPKLARVLELWWRSGWELYTCTRPEPGDFIVPCQHPQNTSGCFSARGAGQAFDHACELAGVDARTMHSTRHTFITMARRGGAPKDIVEKITHNARGDIVDSYTHYDWQPLCDAVLCVSYACGDARGDAGRKQGIKQLPGREYPDAHGLPPAEESAGNAGNLSEEGAIRPALVSREKPGGAAGGDARREIREQFEGCVNSFDGQCYELRTTSSGGEEGTAWLPIENIPAEDRHRVRWGGHIRVTVFSGGKWRVEVEPKLRGDARRGKPPLRSWCPECGRFLLGGEHFEGRACGTCHALCEGRRAPPTPETDDEDCSGRGPGSDTQSTTREENHAACAGQSQRQRARIAVANSTDNNQPGPGREETTACGSERHWLDEQEVYAATRENLAAAAGAMGVLEQGASNG